MALDLNALSGLGDALVEALRVKRLGPGYQQKQALLEQQVEGGRMKLDQEAERAPIELAVLEEQLKSTSAGRRKSEIDLSKIEEDLRRKAEIESIMQRSTGGKSVEELAAEDALYTRKQKREMDAADLAAKLAEASRDRAAASKPAARGIGIRLMDPKTRQPIVWYPNTGETMSAPEGLMDVTTGRQEASGAEEARSFGTILRAADKSLSNYENSIKGMGRFLPTPQRLAASQDYTAKMQGLGQYLGRTVLKDTRVSDSDRVAYTKMIGVDGELIMSYDPTTARRRFNLLKDLYADLLRKYPDVAADYLQGGGDLLASSQRMSGVGQPGMDESPTRPPSVGERRTVRGRLAEWDGRGWKAVR